MISAVTDLLLHRIDWVNVAGLTLPWVTLVWLDRRAREGPREERGVPGAP